MSQLGCPVVIGIDGGGSKTDLAVLSLEGEMVFHARGGGANPQTVGLDESVAVVRALATEALEVSGNRSLLQTSVYLAGMDLPVEIEQFSSAIAEDAWARGADGRRAVVDNDLFALLRAGTDSPDAVAVVCGTGINAVGVRADGRTARFPALGLLSGDWGGGGDLGAAALWHAARSEDGRGPRTSLDRLVPTAYNLGTVREVIEAIHLGRIPARSVADLTPVLFTASTAGDEVAASVIDRQADEIVVLAVTALRRLHLLHVQVPVILGGGVLAANDSRLLTRIELGLEEQAPNAHSHLVTAPPIVGAGLLALEAAGAGTDALTCARREMERSS
ncbi:N-acetylglucosamine kinase [uncultured Arthrobacter sp.]|uniref:N-acetylglucosamine kinase n=1 Tax=uncultured Arthrobacter sp. TaxID=114050 RepID=UPI0026112F7B|nr:BadF/BadG/BcrA/BcrD ATPase family protein [uncultured Arthrobacter sp.]